ncbi:MAG: hypothetical protein GKR90_00025 [Pseudomonadales bacterium]|nr:hypothetical protein [Pseudomonadales bacterium]
MENKSLSKLWTKFVEDIECHRVELFSYCLALTENPFDAEDLASEAMIKTFASSAFTVGNIETPIAFLIRVASRLWVDELRRRTREAEVLNDEESETLPDTSDVSLIYMLDPIQRATFVLHDVFGMSHAEIAHALSISPENSRVILHRGIRKLTKVIKRKSEPSASKELVDRFVEAFRSHDVAQVKALMLDEIETSLFPMGREFRPKDELEWLPSAMSVEAERIEQQEILGENTVLVFVASPQGTKLQEVWVLEESEGFISRVSDYGYAPHIVHWVEGYLGLRSKSES